MASVGSAAYNVAFGIGEGPSKIVYKFCHASGVAKWWEHDRYTWDVARSNGMEIQL